MRKRERKNQVKGREKVLDFSQSLWPIKKPLHPGLGRGSPELGLKEKVPGVGVGRIFRNATTVSQDRCDSVTSQNMDFR